MQHHRRSSGHLKVVRRAKGDTWVAKIRPATGAQFEKVIGLRWTKRSRPPEGYLTTSTAQAVLRGMLVEADEGVLARQQAVGVTFEDACNEWLRYVEFDRQRRASTLSDYKNAVNAVLLPYFGKSTALAIITADDIDAFRVRCIEKGRSAATTNKHLRILHGIFKRSVRAFGLKANPVAGVERQPLIASGDFDVLQPAEVMALARGAEKEQDAALYVTAAFTGLRMGELRALEWQDVDFGKALVHVRRNFTARGGYSLPKSGKVRSVPMVDQVMQALDRLAQREYFTAPDELVFVNVVGGTVDESKTRKRYQKTLERAGLKVLRFHDLRHTFGTLAVQIWPLSDVQAYMGHADIKTTMRYVHHKPKHDAARKLSALIDTETGAFTHSASVAEADGG